MSIHLRLARLEARVPCLPACPECAVNAGMRAVVLEAPQEFDPESLWCVRCSRPPLYTIVVTLDDRPAGVAA